MANASANYGLVPYKNLNGTAFATMSCHTAVGLNQALFVGDPVILAGSGAPLTAEPTVTIAVGAAGTPSTNLFGVVVGVSAVGPDSLNTLGAPAVTANTVQVVPFLPGYIMRCNHANAAESTGGFALNDIGLGYDLRAAAGDTLTGKSGWFLDDTTGEATTATQTRLIGFDNRPDNTWSTTLATDTDDIDVLVVVAQSFWYSDMGAGV